MVSFPRAMNTPISFPISLDFKQLSIKKSLYHRGFYTPSHLFTLIPHKRCRGWLNVIYKKEKLMNPIVWRSFFSKMYYCVINAPLVFLPKLL